MLVSALPLPFEVLIARVCAGDQDAAARLVALAANRLLPLARRRLGTHLQARLDAEDVLQSVFCSFFTRMREGKLECHSGDNLWALLTIITLRKCSNRRTHAFAGCRDVRLETRLLDDHHPSHEVGPEEAAMLVDLLAHLQHPLPPLCRSIVARTLQGETVSAISAELGCPERTVRRVRERFHSDLLALLEAP